MEGGGREGVGGGREGWVGGVTNEGFGGEEVDHKVDRDVVDERDGECKAKEEGILFQVHVVHNGVEGGGWEWGGWWKVRDVRMIET